MLTRQLVLTKINSIVRWWFFSREWVKLTQGEVFSVFNNAHFIRVYKIKWRSLKLTVDIICFLSHSISYVSEISTHISTLFVISVKMTWYFNKNIFFWKKNVAREIIYSAVISISLLHCINNDSVPFSNSTKGCNWDSLSETLSKSNTLI